MKVEALSLPAEWRTARLREAAAFTKKPRGLAFPAEFVPFLPMDLIPAGRTYASDCEMRPVSSLSSGTYVEEGDVLVTKITPCFENGKQAIVQTGSAFAYATTEVIPLKGLRGMTDTLFLHFLLLHPGLRSFLASRMEGSTNRQRLPKVVLEQLQIPVPPLPEQRRIAALLSAVQRAVEQQEKLVALTAELKKALMHKLFTEGTRGEPQKETEIGLIPESWETATLGQLATMKSGGTPNRARSDYWLNGTIPWVKTGEVHYCDILQTEERITEAGLANSSAQIFPAGTLLMAMYGQGVTRGKVAILGLDAATNQACVAILPRSGLLTRFLYYFLECRYDYIRRLAHGANQKNLSAEILRGLIIGLPARADEQQVIVVCLETVDRELAIHGQLRTVMSALFRTLLHQLMTAQLRVDQVDMSELKAIGIEVD